MIGSKERIGCAQRCIDIDIERERATKNTVFRERIGVREEKGLDLDVGTFYAACIRICFLLSGFGFGYGFGYH